jgi:hypothetical protein
MFVRTGPRERRVAGGVVVFFFATEKWSEINKVWPDKSGHTSKSSRLHLNHLQMHARAISDPSTSGRARPGGGAASRPLATRRAPASVVAPRRLASTTACRAAVSFVKSLSERCHVPCPPGRS